MEMIGRAPAYRDHVLYFDALRLVALREEDRNEEALRNRERGRSVYTRICVRTLSPNSSLLLEKAFSPLPARSANFLGGLCFASCSMYLGSYPGFPQKVRGGGDLDVQVMA